MRWIFAVTLCVLVTGAIAQDDKNTTTTSTTQAPTTTPKTTTAAPSPTTTTPKPAPTTTPTPKKYPSNEGRWSVEDEKNVTCILMKGAMEVTVKFSKDNQTVNVDVPISAMASGLCGNQSQSITLEWETFSGNISSKNTITLAFEANETTTKLGDAVGISKGKFGLQNVTGIVYAGDMPVSITITNKAAFQTSLNHSYSCLAQEVLKNDDESANEVEMKFEDIRIEAFRKTAAGHKEFSAAIDCPADDASDIVPIAVGGCLAGLVVVVLIAYLFGRRRSRARGYQSV